MNIFIVTTDEPFYLPSCLLSLLQSDRGKYISGVIVLSPQSKRTGWHGLIKEFYELYGLKDFLTTGFLFLGKKIQKKIPLSLNPNRLCSVFDAAKKAGVPTYLVENINSSEWQKEFKKLKPALLISLSASQIFKKGILELPPLGVVNVHSAPLPQYRGLMPSFWQLYNDEKVGAVTIHWMEEGIDSGDIILQKKFPIAPGETQQTLIQKGKALGAEMVIEVIELFSKYGKNVPTTPNDATKATYYSFPTRVESMEFRKRGKKFR